MDAHALAVLEFPDALALVARQAASAPGAEVVRALVPITDAAAVAEELARVGEMMALLRADARWSMPPVPEVAPALRRLRVEGSALEPGGLRDVGVLLRSGEAARHSLEESESSAPRLARDAEGLARLPQLAGRIERAIDEDGQVRDDATPELSRVRREIAGARSRIVARLTAFAASLPTQYQVSDASISIREGRFVVPVRREGRGDVGGIVHGESGTGATLFIEPPVAIEMMNRLRELESEEAREVHRILREVTGALRPHHAELVETFRRLARLDSVHARGRYAQEVEGSVPAVHEAGEGELVVVQGRHPLLLARDEPVVPFDLTMDAAERTLVISGPNTGGKTVLLKAIGLISLLTQSGIVPPVGEGTRLPVFARVFADIGDEQSIEASLSTFSAHLRNLRATLEHAEASSLVLIDEIGSGTDPVEGGALAQAILLELTRRSCLTVATTHLGQLKLLPTEDARVVNASLQFDAERLEPTYRLLKGFPGRSYGLAIARRLGMPEAVIADAEAALPQGERDVTKLLLALEAKERRAEELGARLAAEAAAAERLRAVLEERERELERRETDAERRARQQARDLLLDAREEVEEAIRQVRDTADEAALEESAREARRRVEEAARRQRERVRAPKRGNARSAAAAPLEVGLRVRVESLGRTGRIVELRDGRAMVETGGLRMLLARDDLTPLPAGDQDPPKPRARASGYSAPAIDASSEVDLRGLRVDELPLKLARALDAALVSGLPALRVIHGKGTGALRAEVQEILRADSRIRDFRPGERHEGGTGVTVVQLQ